MSEKVHQNDHPTLSGDLSAEGNQSAWPPALDLTASSPDPNMGAASQRKPAGDQPTRLSSVKVPGVPQNIVNKIAASEGIRLQVYLDSLSIPTVGIGHKLSEAEQKRWKVGDVLTETQIVSFAQADIGRAWEAAGQQCAELGAEAPNFRMALFEVNFQLGEHWHSVHKKTWAHMQAGQWEQAAQEAANSKWNSQTPDRVANFQRALRKLGGGDDPNLWDKLRSTALSGPGKEAEAVTPPQPQQQGPKPKAPALANTLALTASVGRGGKNLPADLQMVAGFLQQAGAPPVMVAEMLNPAQNGKLIARYQKEVLGFNRPDGRIDPGGKTFKAIAELKGRDVVRGWYRQVVTKNTNSSIDNQANGQTGKDVRVKGEMIPMVMSTSQYFSQYDEGAPCVPLSLLKANLSKKSSEKAYRNVGCYQTCRYMLTQAGFSPGSVSDAEYLLSIETSGEAGSKGWHKTIGGLTENFASSISKLDESLMRGVPVIAGVNKSTKNYDWTNTKPDGNVSPTDHFVVIVGKIITGDGTAAYRFFDPARYSLASGTSPKNLLVQGDDGQFTGKPYSSHKYSLGEIRTTK